MNECLVTRMRKRSARATKCSSSKAGTIQKSACAESRSSVGHTPYRSMNVAIVIARRRVIRFGWFTCCPLGSHHAALDRVDLQDLVAVVVDHLDGDLAG